MAWYHVFPADVCSCNALLSSVVPGVGYWGTKTWVYDRDFNTGGGGGGGGGLCSELAQLSFMTSGCSFIWVSQYNRNPDERAPLKS